MCVDVTVVAFTALYGAALVYTNDVEDLQRFGTAFPGIRVPGVWSWAISISTWRASSRRSTRRCPANCWPAASGTPSAVDLPLVPAGLA
jgi:hypothetical protein